MFGAGLSNVIKGDSDQFNWLCILLGGSFAIFFGSGVLQVVGVNL